MAETVCRIKCLHCRQFFETFMGDPDTKTFLGGSLSGNQMTCRHCGKMTPCNKENMYFNPKDGTIHTGEDTIPKG